MITNIKPNQVFVFSSNSTGFHGAGSAGMAMRGTAANTWRTDEAFLKAMKSPVGSADRKGKWAVYGEAVGYQEGREGRSYAIKTIKSPGKTRTVPLEEIQSQFEKLFEFANEYPWLEFLMTPVGCGYAGYKDGAGKPR